MHAAGTPAAVAPAVSSPLRCTAHAHLEAARLPSVPPHLLLAAGVARAAVFGPSHGGLFYQMLDRSYPGGPPAHHRSVDAGSMPGSGARQGWSEIQGQTMRQLHHSVLSAAAAAAAVAAVLQSQKPYESPAEVMTPVVPVLLLLLIGAAATMTGSLYFAAVKFGRRTADLSHWHRSVAAMRCPAATAAASAAPPPPLHHCVRNGYHPLGLSIVTKAVGAGASDLLQWVVEEVRFGEWWRWW